MIFVQRLGQKIVGAGFHGLDRGIDRGMGGHDDDWEIFGWSDFRESLENLKAGQARHIQIEQHEVRSFLLDQLERLHPILRDHGSIVGGLQAILQHRGNIGIVVDDENFGFHLTPSISWEGEDDSDCARRAITVSSWGLREQGNRPHSPTATPLRFITSPVSGFGKK